MMDLDGLEVAAEMWSLVVQWAGSWKSSSPRMPVPESVVCLALWPVISRGSETAVV